MRGVSLDFIKELRADVEDRHEWLLSQATKDGYDRVSTATVCKEICAAESKVVVLDRNLHSRMSLDPTSARLNMCVTNGIPLGWFCSYRLAL
jgi:hypothetical protein